MMTIHSRVEQLATAAIDFGLTPAEQADVADHLATCPTCRAVAAAYRTDASALREIAFAEPPARDRSAVLTAAAALLLAALLGAAAAIGVWNVRQTLVVTVPIVSPSAEPTAAPAPSVTEAPSASLPATATQTLTLPDPRSDSLDIPVAGMIR